MSVKELEESWDMTRAFCAEIREKLRWGPSCTTIMVVDTEWDSEPLVAVTVTV
jgi:hypothetical protein